MAGAVGIASPTRAQAQVRASRAATAPATVGSVRGVIYDSLRARPLEGATVLVSGAARIGITDATGRFDIDSVATGKHALTFSTPALDSLGLFTLGRDIEVTANAPVVLSLATPSFVTIWRSLCPNTVTPRDSGIVYGAVVNAANNQRLSGARLVFSWTDLSKSRLQVTVDRPVLAVRSDTVGHFYACGLPRGTTVTVHVDASTMGSGPTEVMLDAARIVRRDYLVSSEISREPLSTDTPRRDSTVLRAGSATLRGEVRDLKGNPVASAVITLTSADTSVRTGAGGRFEVGRLPAGTQEIRVRKLGHGPLVTLVELRPGRTTDVSLTLPATTVLAGVNVRANRESNRTLADVELRRRMGSGMFVGEKELATKPDVVSAFQGLPALQVKRRGALATIYFERGSSVCEPIYYLDGKPSNMDEVSFRRPEELYGIEIYSRADAVPAQYKTMNNCGAILVWTRAPR